MKEEPNLRELVEKCTAKSVAVRVSAYEELLQLCTNGDDDAKFNWSDYSSEIDAKKILSNIKSDLNNDSDDISYDAAGVCGCLLANAGFVSFVKMEDQKEIIKCLIQIINERQGRKMYIKTLWCIARSKLSVAAYSDNLPDIISAVIHILKSETSSAAALEALQIILTLSQVIPDVMSREVKSLFPIVFKYLFHDALRVRSIAYSVSSTFKTYIEDPNDSSAVDSSVTLVVVNDLQSVHCKKMIEFVAKEYPDVLTGWRLVIQMLGKVLHVGTSLINDLLEVVEKAFKSSNPGMRIEAFRCWKALIDNFALDDLVITNFKRLRLLLAPLKANNAKTEDIAREKLLVWWHLVIRLKNNAIEHFDLAVLPLLKYCFSGSLSSSSPGGHLVGGLAQRNLMMSVATTSTSPGRKFAGLHTLCAEVLAQLLSTGLDIANQQPFIYSTASLDIPLVTQSLFSRTYQVIFSCVSEALQSLSDDKNLRKTRHYALGVIIIKAIIARVTELVHCETNKKEAIEKVKELFTVFYELEKRCIPGDSLSHFVFMFYELILTGDKIALPLTVINSRSFYISIGSTVQGMMSGTLSNHLIHQLCKPSMLHLAKYKEGFFTLWIRLIENYKPSTGKLGFLQLVIKELDAVDSGLCCDLANIVRRLWAVTLRQLLQHIQETQIIDQGDGMEHEWSCVYSFLTYPVNHSVEIFRNVTEDFNQQIMADWSELWLKFIEFTPLAATSVPNSEVEHVSKAMLVICKKISSGSFSDSVGSAYNLMANILNLITQRFRYSELGKPSMRYVSSPAKPRKRPHQLQNLASCFELNVLLFNGLLQLGSCTGRLSTAKLLCESLTNILKGVTHDKMIIRIILELINPLTEALKINPSVRFNDETAKLFVRLLRTFSAAFEKHIGKAHTADHLQKLDSLFQVTLTSANKGVKLAGRQMWRDSFGSTKQMIPSSLKKILKDCSLPPVSLIDSQDDMDELQTEPKENVPENITVGVYKRIGVLEPSKLRSLKFESPTHNKKNLGTPKSKDKKDSMHLLEMREEDFVKIASPKSSKRILTEHQIEKLSERKDIPALYADLSQTASQVMIPTQFTSQYMDESILNEPARPDANKNASEAEMNKSSSKELTFSTYLRSNKDNSDSTNNIGIQNNSKDLLIKDSSLQGYETASSIGRDLVMGEDSPSSKGYQPVMGDDTPISKDHDLVKGNNTLNSKGKDPVMGTNLKQVNDSHELKDSDGKHAKEKATGFVRTGVICENYVDTRKDTKAGADILPKNSCEDVDAAASHSTDSDLRKESSAASSSVVKVITNDRTSSQQVSSDKITDIAVEKENFFKSLSITKNQPSTSVNAGSEILTSDSPPVRCTRNSQRKKAVNERNVRDSLTSKGDLEASQTQVLPLENSNKNKNNDKGTKRRANLRSSSKESHIKDQNDVENKKISKHDCSTENRNLTLEVDQMELESSINSVSTTLYNLLQKARRDNQESGSSTIVKESSPSKDDTADPAEKLASSPVATRTRKRDSMKSSKGTNVDQVSIKSKDNQVKPTEQNTSVSSADKLPPATKISGAISGPLDAVSTELPVSEVKNHPSSISAVVPVIGEKKSLSPVKHNTLSKKREATPCTSKLYSHSDSYYTDEELEEELRESSLEMQRSLKETPRSVIEEEFHDHTKSRRKSQTPSKKTVADIRSTLKGQSAVMTKSLSSPSSINSPSKEAPQTFVKKRIPLTMIEAPLMKTKDVKIMPPALDVKVSDIQTPVGSTCESDPDSEEPIPSSQENEPLYVNLVQRLSPAPYKKNNTCASLGNGMEGSSEKVKNAVSTSSSIHDLSNNKRKCTFDSNNVNLDYKRQKIEFYDHETSGRDAVQSVVEDAHESDGSEKVVSVKKNFGSENLIRICRKSSSNQSTPNSQSNSDGSDDVLVVTPPKVTRSGRKIVAPKKDMPEPMTPPGSGSQKRKKLELTFENASVYKSLQGSKMDISAKFWGSEMDSRVSEKSPKSTEENKDMEVEIITKINVQKKITDMFVTESKMNLIDEESLPDLCSSDSRLVKAIGSNDLQELPIELNSVADDEGLQRNDSQTTSHVVPPQVSLESICINNKAENTLTSIPENMDAEESDPTQEKTSPSKHGNSLSPKKKWTQTAQEREITVVTDVHDEKTISGCVNQGSSDEIEKTAVAQEEGPLGSSECCASFSNAEKRPIAYEGLSKTSLEERPMPSEGLSKTSLEEGPVPGEGLYKSSPEVDGNNVRQPAEISESDEDSSDLEVDVEKIDSDSNEKEIASVVECNQNRTHITVNPSVEVIEPPVQPTESVTYLPCENKQSSPSCDIVVVSSSDSKESISDDSLKILNKASDSSKEDSNSLENGQRIDEEFREIEKGKKNTDEVENNFEEHLEEVSPEKNLSKFATAVGTPERKKRIGSVKYAGSRAAMLVACAKQNIKNRDSPSAEITKYKVSASPLRRVTPGQSSPGTPPSHKRKHCEGDSDKPWAKHEPSPCASPSPSILKKPLLDDSFSRDNSPPSKQRRVSFADPPVSDRVEIPPSPKTLRGMRAQKRLDMTKADPPVKASSISSSQPDESQGEPESPTNINCSQPFYAPLVDCKDLVDCVATQLTSPFLYEGLKMVLEERGIHTVGHLSRLTEADINRLPIRTPKLSLTLQILQKYEENKLSGKKKTNAIIDDVEAQLSQIFSGEEPIGGQYPNGNSLYKADPRVLEELHISQGSKVTVLQSGLVDTDDLPVEEGITPLESYHNDIGCETINAFCKEISSNPRLLDDLVENISMELRNRLLQKILVELPYSAVVDTYYEYLKKRDASNP
ncbi:hypothetical protein SK128_005114 [Halocaridina rubra]|uniref:Telomere-associated protein Rif1 N-terminal domain-containing protein n=1 Tax=Halocaridina rubra TaxID=373956 RepID=A0AAN8ZWP3_HALRR